MLQTMYVCHDSGFTLLPLLLKLFLKLGKIAGNECVPLMANYGSHI